MPEPGPGTPGDRLEIVLADDHALVRGGLRRVLESEADLTVVAEAGDVEGALRLTREHRPQVVVLDLNMPGSSTVDAIPDFLDAAPGCTVLVVTMDGEPSSARWALSAGARGYVLKNAAETELVDAVRAVSAGRTYLDPSLGATLATMGETWRGPAVAHLDPRRVVGSQFAGYRIDAILGRGGMGVVFRATDLALDRTVALKQIAPEAVADPVSRDRFERECRLAAAIDHPHAVQIFHAGEHEGVLYLTMRYIDGPNMLTLLRDQGVFGSARAVSLLHQLAGALDEAHRLGLVHRDVKPANVLIENRPGGEHAFLTDFGLTKPTVEDSVTRTAAPLGTVDYIAPEQARGAEVDARADVYSLGCVLFVMLTGEVVFDRDGDLATLWAHVHDPPPKLRSIRPELPGRLEQVIDRALAKDPGERPQSAGELAREASAAIGPENRG
jgi:DNA-binding NarL/FixJ family response regulator/tRNA A-37 threonylcarbamoyl transferase component Bud32